MRKSGCFWRESVAVTVAAEPFLAGISSGCDRQGVGGRLGWGVGEAVMCLSRETWLCKAERR